QTIVNNAQYLRVVTQPDGSELRFTETNPAAGRVTVVVNPWLPLIDQSANSATTWYLVPSGGSSGPRPSIITTFMPGREASDLQTIVNNAQYLRVVTQPDGSELRFTETNPAAGRVTVVVNPWLPLIDQSENSATTWYLVPSGGSSGPRQSIITTFMTGREAPELRISGDTGNYIGGGEVPGTEGSFLNDDVQYRVRHITGAVGLDPSPTMASLGNDSIS